jgi:DNA-binding CsgD family transcriptional regulator
VNDWPTYRRIAQQVCTPAELEALAYYIAGVPTHRIALALGISRRAVRDRLSNADRKVTNHPEWKETA